MSDLTTSIDILQNFENKCNEIKVWYSLSGTSLLEAKSEREYNQNVIEVMMLAEHYNRFVSAFSTNIIDSLTSDSYFYSLPFYFEPGNNIVIKINLLVKASIKKAEKTYSLINLIRQRVGYYKSIKSASSFKQSFWKSFYSVVGLFISPLTWQEISSSMFVEEQNGYFLIDSFKPNINKNWIPSLTFKRNDAIWKNQKTKVLKEWELVLIKRYGRDWAKSPELEKNPETFEWISQHFN